ncbi:hypothetical protein ElyMa_005789600 [Elysia marginata]|uniref:SERTA domain-containing protein n=1 Tax=Elysia marginata TaxID=1093978 RepID=A0AAV4FUJ3_9GAST|nr:hypothetical protein ElyMa_005789600 [Elysia marginata]
MDAEVLKCKRTDDIMSSYMPKTRRCLYLMSYFNSKDYSMPLDDKQRLYYEQERRLVSECKRALTRLLTPLLKFPNGSYRPAPVNIVAYSLRFLQVALYHQCREPHVPKQGFTRFVDLSERFKGMMLGIDSDDPGAVNQLFHDFSVCLGDVAFKKRDVEMHISMFVCPLCIRQDVYTGVGWTSYVCPKPLGQTSCDEMYNGVISKRGCNEDMMPGECCHISSLQKLLYDWMFSDR